MAAWSRKTLKNVNFCVFFGKTIHYWKICKNFVPKEFIVTTIDVFVRILWNLADEKSVKLCVAHLTKKNNFSPSSPALATAQIDPKIWQGRPQIMYPECSRFHQNRFTFVGVIGLSERVNTVRVHSNVHAILGWSLTSSRIINTSHDSEWWFGRMVTLLIT